MKYSSQADAAVIYTERNLLSRSTIEYERIHFWFGLTRADAIQLESAKPFNICFGAPILSVAGAHVQMNENNQMSVKNPPAPPKKQPFSSK